MNRSTTASAGPNGPATSPDSGSFRFGDLVVHSRRPEWGTGTVTKAERIRHDGQPAQRLTIRFPSEGLKVINTGIVAVAPAPRPGENGPAAPAAPAAASGWLGRLEADRPEERMTEVPEPARDPFRSVWDRIETTLGLYRFTTEARSLTDWAIAQSGLSDPLSSWSRQELEAFFERFTRRRDEHLRALLLEADREDPDRLRAMLAAVRGPAQPVVRRWLDGRR